MSNLDYISMRLNQAVSIKEITSLEKKKENIIIARLLLAVCSLVFILLTVHFW